MNCPISTLSTILIGIIEIRIIGIYIGIIGICPQIQCQFIVIGVRTLYEYCRCNMMLGHWGWSNYGTHFDGVHEFHIKTMKIIMLIIMFIWC